LNSRPDSLTTLRSRTDWRHGSLVRLTVAWTLLILLASFGVPAQPTSRLPRIGFLSPTVLQARHQAFWQGLRDLGYVEGQTILIETRSAEGREERLPELAAELVRLPVDVIVVAASTPAILAAKQATSTIPIVMSGSADPVGTGLVASLARPGGNVTGLSLFSREVSAKRLQLLQELSPGATRVAVLWNVTNPARALDWKEIQAAAPRLGLELQSLGVRQPDDFHEAFRAATRGQAEALLILGDPLTVTHRHQVVDFVAQSRLPAVYEFKEFIELGFGHF
jgi:putative tryptophan/tyrosine transport system substrate-binding protein